MTGKDILHGFIQPRPKFPNEIFHSILEHLYLSECLAPKFRLVSRSFHSMATPLYFLKRLVTAKQGK